MTQTHSDPMRVHFDLETADPDDVMALCILATHPRCDLVGVSVFPGGSSISFQTCSNQLDVA